MVGCPQNCATPGPLPKLSHSYLTLGETCLCFIRFSTKAHISEAPQAWVLCPPPPILGPAPRLYGSLISLSLGLFPLEKWLSFSPSEHLSLPRPSLFIFLCSPQFSISIAPVSPCFSPLPWLASSLRQGGGFQVLTCDCDLSLSLRFCLLLSLSLYLSFLFHPHHFTSPSPQFLLQLIDNFQLLLLGFT